MKEDKTKNETEETSRQLEECRKQKDEYLEGWKRARADFLNYKKEEMERIGELLKYANQSLILKLLPILDSLEIAEKEIPKDLEKNKWVDGFLKIKIQILDFLKGQGIEEIQCLGQKFNPNFQEVVEEIEAKDKEPQIVVEEIKKGYTLYGRVLRPAKVKIVK